MKKIISVVIISAFVAACTNSDNTEKTTTDSSTNSIRNQPTQDTSANKDTSSYQRMPNKQTDSMR